MTEPAPAYQPAPAYSGAPATVPGKGLGIAALILSFFFQLIALILGIIALNQSKKAGAKNTPAVVAIVLGLLFTIGYIIIFSVIGAGVAAFSSQCAELGSGVHTDGAVTITCP